jgi:hypothetical protein
LQQQNKQNEEITQVQPKRNKPQSETSHGCWQANHKAKQAMDVVKQTAQQKRNRH